MDGLQEFVNVFGNGFFPIVCCGVLFWLLSKLQKTLTEISESLVLMNERLKDIENKKAE